MSIPRVPYTKGDVELLLDPIDVQSIAQKFDESKHPRDEAGKFTELIGLGTPKSAEEAHTRLTAMHAHVEGLYAKQGEAADKARAAWATWTEDLSKGRKKPLKADGAAAKKLPSYKAALEADVAVSKAWDDARHAKEALNIEAKRLLLIPKEQRSKVEFLVRTGELHSDPRVEQGIANGAKRALEIFRRYDGSGELIGPAIPADKLDALKAIVGPDMEFDTDEDGTIRIAKRLRLTRVQNKGERANATPFGVQLNGSIELERTILHEVGHHVEFANKAIYDAAVELRNKLTTEPHLYSMNQLKGSTGYGQDEVGAKGTFIDPYAGKIYPKEVQATELVSMGYENYIGDPIGFAVKAPDHFKFIWDVAHGKYQQREAD